MTAAAVMDVIARLAGICRTSSRRSIGLKWPKPWFDIEDRVVLLTEMCMVTHLLDHCWKASSYLRTFPVSVVVHFFQHQFS